MQQHGCWSFVDVYDKNAIKKINVLVKKNMDATEGVDHPAEHVVKTSEVSFIPWGAIRFELAQIEDCVRAANRRNFAYDIFPFDASTILHYNVYKEGGEYQWHQDMHRIEDASDIKLTVIVNLSEKSYKGGQLMLKVNDYEELVDLTPGSIVVFKSFLSHQVTPVTEGERISLTTWVEGPKFR